MLAVVLSLRDQTTASAVAATILFAAVAMFVCQVLTRDPLGVKMFEQSGTMKVLPRNSRPAA
jgi:hypothetical protein